jgi:hypothetical protein
MMYYNVFTILSLVRDALTVSVNVQEVLDTMIRQRDAVDIRIARSKAVKTGHQNRTAVT